MTKELFMNVMSYWIEYNLWDWRTKLCLLGALITLTVIIVELLVKFVFYEIAPKSFIKINTCLLIPFIIYIVVVIASFTYNYNCYMADEVIRPLVEEEKYIEAMEVINNNYLIGIDMIQQIIDEIHEPYTYQLAEKYESEGRSLDAFIMYNGIIEFKDSRERAIELIPKLEEELNNG